MRIRTGYSFGTAVGKLDEVISRLQAIGWQSAPITDRMSTFGFARWTKACKDKGLKPIYGVELAVVPRLGDKKPVTDYWTFIAKENIASINNLVSLATSVMAKEPCLTYDQALKANGVIKISGERVQLEYVPKKAAANDFYIGLGPALPKGLYDAAKFAKFKFIAVSDNYYPAIGDEELYRVTIQRANAQTYPRHILDDDEWREQLAYMVDTKTMKQALATRNDLMKLCNATIQKAELFKPVRKKTLREMCIDGAKAKKVNLKNKVYADRLDRELKLIHEKKFEDYFYIISDLVSWAKQRMMVGPARGSSCGSLVCYLLNITEIDPIPYDLIFERFIDINRLDLPDIDIDFSDAKRELVFEHAAKQFGADNVARLGTVGMYKSKSALKKISNTLWIPTWMVDKVSEGVIKRSSGDARAMQSLEDALADTPAGQELIKQYPEARIATRIEGHPNNASQHAAGIVVTKKPIINYVAIDSRTNSAMCDKKDAEAFNLLKIDALGLTQLSIFENVARRIGKPDRNGWMENIPLNDKKAFDVLNKGHFAGIFQFQGAALQTIAKQVKFETIEDIISLTALARPGPFATGGTATWLRRRTGQEKVTTEHPMLTELTKGTYGVVVYQETVMQIVRQLGHLSWEDTSELRKAMSRSLGEEFFDKYKAKFLEGAKQNKIDDETALLIWKKVNTFGNWAFNRSHAVAYGMVSYQCCWLKAHYPLEFAAASLDAESDANRQLLFLRELNDEGIKYEPLNAKYSTDRWEISNGKIIGPLTNAKGIGPSSVMEILDCRKHKKPIRPALAKRLDNATTDLDSLFPIRDAIARTVPDLNAVGIISKPTPVKQVQPGVKGLVMVIGIADKIAVKDLNEHVNVEKRGYKIKGPHHFALNLFITDDQDRIFCRINREDFDELAKPVVERGRVGRAIYAVKGEVPKDFRMISVTNLKYLGDLEEEHSAINPERASEGRTDDND